MRLRSLQPRLPYRVISSADVVRLFASVFNTAPREQFWFLALDAEGAILRVRKVAHGARSHCSFSLQRVFREALALDAQSLIFVHNHPIGSAAPSGADIALTQWLKRAGELIGVRVLDHVIIAKNGHYSFRDAGICLLAD